MALYPPILQSSMAPIKAGTVLNFSIELSKFMSSNDVSGIELKVNDAESHKNMLNPKQIDNRIVNPQLVGSKYKITHNLTNSLDAGHLYKIQARFYQESEINGNMTTKYSEWSNIMIVKAI